MNNNFNKELSEEILTLKTSLDGKVHTLFCTG